MKTYARLGVGNIVAEILQLPDDIDISTVFAAALLWIDVTALAQAPVVGMVASETAGVWSFADTSSSAATPIVPQQVTPYQAKAVLFGMPGVETGKTLLDDVNAWVAAEGGLLELAWQSATVVTRNGQFVTAGAQKFGWTNAQLDQMFISAAAVQG